MPPPSLRDVAAALTRHEDRLAIDTPDAWAQGQTLYGGMTAALCYLAATAGHDMLPPLRSAQLVFAGPAAGRLTFHPATLRQGKSSAVLGVDCRTPGGVAARGHFVFGKPRASAVSHQRVEMPDWPPPDDCPPLHRTSKPLPGFLGRFDYRRASPSGLFEPAATPELAVWVRLRTEAPDDPVVGLLALADALPCAAMVAFPKPAPISTMSWHLDLHGPPGDMRGWHLLSSSSESAADGYSVQAMRVFDATGRPLAAGRQMVAIFA